MDLFIPKSINKLKIRIYLGSADAVVVSADADPSAV